ncbi:glucan biosynthesis protein [uncultured Enterovirga sp.]|uniref:glucan biosynthesis protein n=1 Tax=uncultured Enterovirga sp. TaxID=2026352 RepID=UPI0035CBC5D8
MEKPKAVAQPGRREVVASLGAGWVAAALPAGSALAQANTPQALIQNALGEGQRFEPGSVTELARALSKRAFVPPPNDLPEPFAGLNYERYVAIKSLPSGRIWDGENRGFVVEPLARGFVFTTAVTLFTVEDGQVRRIMFDKGRFDFGGLAVPANAPDPGFSGFRLDAVGAGGPPFEFALIQGATFFRAAARGQNLGIVARALALKPAETRGEEFPIFRAFWLERPVAGTNALVIHGLVDSESVAGSVRMTFRPGEATIVDVETTLFPRVNLEHVGFGGMGATFLYGPNVRRGIDDLRPAVYDASGLSILNGQGEWLWRPLNNPDTLQISAFLDDNPKGFGLLQRERDFGAFQDDVQHFEARPSLWIEPIGDWSQGAVQLIEIPSDSEINKNILAYWRPKAAMQAGSEVTLAYRQFWSWAPPDRPQLATVTSTRSGRGPGGRRRRFIVEFGGEALGAAIPDLKVALTTAPGLIQNQRTWLYAERKSVRVGFDLDPGGDNACEMRLVLQSGAKPLSETWLYRWTP